ncbi:hypothetical protein [Rhizobiales bacterium]|uniref:hypothetical protein n=1 Tax=Ensifer sp. R-19 TaxID=3404055 RepID=UPI000DE272D3
MFSRRRAIRTPFDCLANILSKSMHVVLVATLCLVPLSLYAQTPYEKLWTYLVGEEFRVDLASLLRMDNIDAPELTDLVKALGDLKKPMEDYQNQKTPDTPTSDQVRTDLSSIMGSIERSKQSLRSFSIKVQRGEYEGYISPEFWTRCMQQLGSPLGAVEGAFAIADSKQGDDKAKAEKLKPFEAQLKGVNGEAYLKCQGEAQALSTQLAQKSDKLGKDIEELEKQAKEIEQKYKPGDSKREELLKKNQEQKDQKVNDKRKTDEAKQGVDTWAIISGLIMIAAGLIVVFYFGIPQGWALVAGGFAMILEGMGKKKRQKPGGQPGSDAAAVAGQEDEQPTNSAAKVKDADQKGKGGVDATAAQNKFGPQGFTTVESKAPKGNLLLMFNGAEKVLIVVQVDTAEQIVKIELSKAKTGGPGVWAEDLKLTDLTALSDWSIDTSGNFVLLNFKGTFPTRASAVALFEARDGAYVASSAEKPVGE